MEISPAASDSYDRQGTSTSSDASSSSSLLSMERDSNFNEVPIDEKEEEEEVSNHSYGTTADSPPPPVSSRPYEDDDEEEDVCRICRNPGDADNPLRYPCACSGSIKFVHQDCLLQWLNHSNARQCEVFFLLPFFFSMCSIVVLYVKFKGL